MATLEHTKQLYRFNGGLKLDLHHDESTGKPIKSPPLPAQLILPLQQYQGHRAQACVKPGDYVFKGQVIAQPHDPLSVAQHAPTSGTVIEIGLHALPCDPPAEDLCIIIEPDEQERWGERNTQYADYTKFSPDLLRAHLQSSGITGLGGAGFPSAHKLNTTQTIELLLINAAECEPYISCDDSLLRQYAAEVVQGIAILQHCLQAKACAVAVEAGMPEAHAALQHALQQHNLPTARLYVVPEIYPVGGERQLIQTLTGQQVPLDGLPADLGIICHNVATAAAIYRAVIKGEPMISRIVTVTGAVADPRNLQVLLGTPIQHLLTFCGGINDAVAQLLIGGAMMGTPLHHLNAPITKTVNCVLAATGKHRRTQGQARPCIRCGLCEQVCPASLLPQQLYWYAQADNFTKAQEYHLFSCIECGCCSYVCPSEIPLVDYYRYAKQEIRRMEQEKHKAAAAKQRFAARERRLQQQDQHQQQTRQQKKHTLKDDIQAALARKKRDQ